MERGNFLLQDIRSFDAAFFGIPPKMAENLDPQQRLLLEVVWEAFENAGLDLTAHAGRKVGVYVGGFMLDHMITQMARANRSLINQNTAAGMMMTMLSNRISHAFDLRGPSLSIDTACSSSLVAFNYACQDIWNGSTSMALVGGANVMTRPEYPVGMCKGQFLSRDGQCKSFDARGDGYGRGEGAGVVLLKALDQALADGDRILATVVGTGANSDGRTPGISMPSEEAQRQLIEEVCSTFGIDRAEVRYVECHGTGTAVGDPIEARSVGSVYGAGRSGDDRVVIGSIKSNIGHLEAAAGVAGVIKAVMSLQHRTATPLANLQTPHPDIPFDALGIRLADGMIGLARPDEPLLAAVNSFGYGGTNAHAVLRAAPAPAQAAAEQPPPRAFPHFLPISTRSPAALKALAGRLADQLGAFDASIEDIVHTASHRRAHLSHRGVVIGNTREALVDGLRALAAGQANEAACSGTQPYAGRRAPVFVFTGMGPQWWAMGRELYRDEPVYRAALDHADRVFESVAGFSILAELLADEQASRITQTQFAQPANFMVQHGLATLLRAAGVEPGAIVGHSVGEVTAAHEAGVLSLEDALRVSFHRSRLQALTAGSGSMLAVGLGEEAAKGWLAGFEGQIDIAAINGPATLTLAGDSTALKILADKLTAAEIFNRALTVEVAYHSHLMDPILAELQQVLGSLSPSEPSTPLFSTVTGEKVQGPSYGADYWPHNVRRPVSFMKAVQALLDDGYTTFIEVGPHPVLSSALRDCAKAGGKDVRLVETLRRNTPGERQRVLLAAAQVYAHGCDIDWQRLASPGRFVPLPNYPWQRERYWLESEHGELERLGPVSLPMLGMQEVPASLVWRNDLENEPLQYLREHVVSGMPVMPAAGYLEALFELASRVHPDAGTLVVRNVSIAAPLLIAAERAVDFVTAYDRSTRTAAIRSSENGKVGEGQTHVTAELAGHAPVAAEPVDIAALCERLARPEDLPTFYKGLARIGLGYGPRFQTVRELRVDRAAGQVLARIELDPRELSQLALYRAHPTLLDGCFQALIGMLDTSGTTYLPTTFAELRLARALPAAFWCHGLRVSQSAGHIDSDLVLLDDAGELLGVVRGMRAVAVPSKAGRIDQYGDAVKRQILAYSWAVAGRLSEPKRLGHWLLVEGQQAPWGGRLAERLEAFGARVQARVRLGSGRSDAEPGVITIRPDHLHDVAGVLASVGRLDGVAFLHGLDATPDSADPIAMHAIELMVAFTKALTALPGDQRPRVYTVTQGAFHVEEYDSPVQPSQTAINGFARVAFNEIEGLRFTSIDLPADLRADRAEEQLEALTFELLCDAPEDEVALRGQTRLFSELLETPAVEKPRVAFVPLAQDNPVLVRPLQESDQGTGTLKLLQAPPAAALGAHDIELRVEAMGLPISTLADPDSDALDQPLVEVVGIVTAVGSGVGDLRPNTRVCGYAPAEIASHLRGARKEFHLVPVAAEVRAEDLVGAIGLHGRAERVAELAALEAGATALVYADAMGMAVAAALSRAGARVTLLTEPDQTPDRTLTFAHGCFETTPEGVERAVRKGANGGFDAVVAPMSLWVDRFGFRCLRPGAILIDTDVVSRPLSLPTEASTVIRCDAFILGQRSARFGKAIARAVALLASGSIDPEHNLVVSATDLAWKRLEVPSTNAPIVLKFDNDGRDAPVYLQDRVEFRPDATYLVTGGFGGFGQKTALWLVEHGARHLALVGRTGADTEERQAFVRSLRARGVSVMCVACDTTERSQMADVLGQIKAGGHPLRGVFHSAAVIIDQAIADIDRDTLFKVMRNKAMSAWVLHQLTAGLELDHFVLYSSIANSVGNSRQASYVAANGFLDGLAWHRRALGLPATSVNWGAISDVGVVTRDEKLEQFLRYIGLRGISSQEGLDLLGKALLRDVTQFCVTVITNWGDWARYETLGGKSPRFANLISADTNPADAAVRERIRAELAAIPAQERFEVLSALIAEVIANELQSTADAIAIDRPINELGVDSLMATEIQLLLESKLAVAVSVLELLGDATIRKLTERTLRELELDGVDAAASAAPQPA
jgi:acyl transferase domain-containing protein/NADP-dependent 3-hydroxy acid dehydrogenase YdfG/acyl carrier protein